MLKLEDIGKDARVDGLEPVQIVHVISVEPAGGDAVSVHYKTGTGRIAAQMVFRQDEARKLQPYFVRAFFSEAFQSLGGEMRPRETGRYEIRHVPASIRERDRVIGETRTTVLRKYERICFERSQQRVHGKPMAELIHPGHPLMHATTDLVLDAHRTKLRQGAVLLDPNDEGTDPRMLFMLDHSAREGSGDQPRTLSRRLQFVTIDAHGAVRYEGVAPHLDLQPISGEDRARIDDMLRAPWIQDGLEVRVLKYASEHLAAGHYQEIRSRRERQADRILAAVQDRLVKEINYLSGRALKLEMDVQAGEQPRMQADNMKRAAEELTARLEQRKRELTAMKSVVSSTPVVLGGALIIPQGLLSQRKGQPAPSIDAAARARVERVAMEAVMNLERILGHTVSDVFAANVVGTLPRNRGGRRPVFGDRRAGHCGHVHRVPASTARECSGRHVQQVCGTSSICRGGRASLARLRLIKSMPIGGFVERLKAGSSSGLDAVSARLNYGVPRLTP